MKMQNCSVRITPAPWFRPAFLALVLCAFAAVLPAADAPAGLTPLVRAYRLNPSPARRAHIEAYGLAHPGEAAQVRLALGVADYEQKNFMATIAELRAAVPKFPRIADYIGYYLAAARVEANDFDGVAKDLEPVFAAPLASPFAGRAWLLEARALKPTDAAGAVRLLRDHYAILPQPDGDLTLADCYQAAGDLPNAVDFYQRIYYQYVVGDASSKAAAALLALQDAMGAAYPQPLPEQKLRRADRLLEAHLYSAARDEYQAIATGNAPPLVTDQARVGVGAADFLDGRAAQAYTYLSGLNLAPSEADAERIFYMEGCARGQGDDSGMASALQQLSERYPKSPWRLKALLGAANHYLASNRPDDFLPLFKAVYTDFPEDSAAANAHWKVAFQAYLQDKSDATDLLQEHLRNYPGHSTAAAALYFFGRLAERNNDLGAAKAYYQRLASAFENYYYGLLANDRLSDPRIAAEAASDKAAQFTAALDLPQAHPIPAQPNEATTGRIERSRILRSAGLTDLADGELRFGGRNGGQPFLLAMEMAGAADAPHMALHFIKTLVPDYLSIPLDAAPRKFWEFLFPLPYRAELNADAKRHDLDPYLVAGLIRQESEFNPGALSHANAYGLTQVRPITGRQYAHDAGLSRFTARALLQPAVNLKIGTSILRVMLDHNGGRMEQTLASYNAGPNRAAEWIGWRNYREPAEFVESIPYAETRDYVQAVLRNADIYRRLYGDK
jgi:soluble lytic murein transglycosylase